MQNGSLNGFSEHHHDTQTATNGEQSTSPRSNDFLSNLTIGTVITTPLDTERNLCKDVDNDGPPSKKRKTSEVTPRPRSASRYISPPWKRVAVEGPTSFLEGGKRKSARTNLVPLELQPQAEKRQTRAAIQKTHVSKSKYGGATSHKSSPSASTLRQQHSHDKRPVSAGGTLFTLLASHRQKAHNQILFHLRKPSTQVLLPKLDSPKMPPQRQPLSSPRKSHTPTRNKRVDLLVLQMSRKRPELCTALIPTDGITVKMTK